MRKAGWIITAILFGLCGARAGTVDRIVVQVNDEIITLSELNRHMAAARRELAAKYSGDKLEEMIKNAEKQTLEGLIREKLLYQKAVELGFNANVEARVSAYIQQLMKENNIKDTEELAAAFEQQGESLADYREQLRRQIIARDLVQEFVGSRITLLTPEIEKFYKDNAAEFTVPEEVTLSEIILTDPDAGSRAEEILRRLREGESFAALASQYSKGPTANKGGGIGTYVLEKLNPEIVAAIKGLKEGEVSRPQKIKEGWVVYRVDSRKPAHVRLLEEVREEIQDRLYQRRFTPELERYIAQLKEDAYIQYFTEIK
jgi:peptidyl-prolyl cis-trans isomerase SurA